MFKAYGATNAKISVNGGPPFPASSFEINDKFTAPFIDKLRNGIAHALVITNFPRPAHVRHVARPHPHNRAWRRRLDYHKRRDVAGTYVMPMANFVFPEAAEPSR